MTKIEKKDISVVIVSYNNAGVLIESIKSVYKYNDIGDSVEVIVVDNSPTDELYLLIANTFPKVNIIKNKNKGFGEGNNVGANISKGKFLLFLNPDALLVEPVFNFAINVFEKDAHLGMFGVKMIDRNGSNNMSFFMINGGGLIRSVFIKLFNYLDFFVDGVMYTSGANIFIRRRDFYSCGKFDENIFMYYEEPDLTRRLRSIGKKTKFFNNKKIIHLEGVTTPNKEPALRRRLDSMIYFRNKYKQDPRKFILRELRLNYFKLFLTQMLRSDRSVQLKSSINILNEYLRSCERQPG